MCFTPSLNFKGNREQSYPSSHLGFCTRNQLNKLCLICAESWCACLVPCCDPFTYSTVHCGELCELYPLPHLRFWTLNGLNEMSCTFYISFSPHSPRASRGSMKREPSPLRLHSRFLMPPTLIVLNSAALFKSHPHLPRIPLLWSLNHFQSLKCWIQKLYSRRIVFTMFLLN